MIENLSQFLRDQVLQVFRIPQCITEGLTTGFILDLVDLFCTEEQWHILSQQTRFGKIQRVLDSLEESNQLKSGVVKVKERYFDDDIERPKLPKRCRVYRLNR